MKIETKAIPNMPYLTDWVFNLKDEPEMFERFVTLVELTGQDLYERFSGMGQCPALAESDPDGQWGWTEISDINESEFMSYDRKEMEIRISVENRPDDEFDCLDPSHPEFFSPSPMQWLKVLRIIRRVIECNCVESLAIYNPFHTADFRDNHAVQTIQ